MLLIKTNFYALYSIRSHTDFNSEEFQYVSDVLTRNYSKTETPKMETMVVEMRRGEN